MYNQFQNPVFFIDELQYRFAVGLMDKDSITFSDYITGFDKDKTSKLFTLDPSLKHSMKFGSFNFPDHTHTPEMFLSAELGITDLEELKTLDQISLFVLGHNFKSTGIYKTTLSLPLENFSIINYETNAFSCIDGYTIMSRYNNSTLSETNNLNDTFLEFSIIGAESYAYEENSEIEIGCISFCVPYAFPHSPNMEITTSYDFGLKTQNTIGGERLDTYNWQKPQKWGDLPCWELHDPSDPFPSVEYNGETIYSTNKETYFKHSKLGRRSWEMSFTMLGDEKLFGTSYSLDTDYYNSDFENINTGWSKENSFYYNVLHKTLGGKLPFIFHPNADQLSLASEDILSEFAICKLDMNNISFTQIANGVYDVNLRIVECW